MEELRDIWQNQEVEEMKISVEELRTKAARFRRGIVRRNLTEQLACGAVAIWFGTEFWKTAVVIPRISFALIAAAALYVAWHIQTRGRAGAVPVDMARSNLIEFQRTELEKQRDLLKGVWRWYLGPFVAGLGLLAIWGMVVAPTGRRWSAVAFAVTSVLIFWGIGRLNRTAARKLEEQLEELKSLGA